MARFLSQRIKRIKRYGGIKMKKGIKKIYVVLMVLTMFFMVTPPVFASVVTETIGATETATNSDEAVADTESTTGDKAIAAAIAVGLAAAAGAIGMGMAVAKSVEAISRQPEAEGKIRTTLMLGLVFVETAIIYALVIAILVIFVL